MQHYHKSIMSKINLSTKPQFVCLCYLATTFLFVSSHQNFLEKLFQLAGPKTISSIKTFMHETSLVCWICGC